jgi:chromate transport protein ChrA
VVLLHQKYRIALRPIFWILLVLAAIQIFVWLAPPLFSAKGIANYAPLHTLLEFIAIVIAVLVFAVGWGAYDKERPSNFMLLACTFGGVAILDLPLHAGWCWLECCCWLPLWAGSACCNRIGHPRPLSPDAD